jgi:tripartite-type tricarboxylate transporter receptor subunit TctC
MDEMKIQMPRAALRGCVGYFSSLVIDRLSREMSVILRRPEVVKQLEQQGVSVQDSYPDPDEMKSFVSSQLDIWRRLVADEGIERE